MNAIRQGRPLPCHVFLDNPGRFDFVLVDTGNDLQGRIRFAVEATERLGLYEAVLDIRDIRQRQPRAICECSQNDLAELGTGIRLTLGAQQDIAAFGLDRSARPINGTVPDRLRDFAHRQAVLAQRPFRHFNADLVGAVAVKNDIVDLRHAQQVVANFITQRFAPEIIEIAMKGNHDDRHHHLLLVNDRLFRQRRERRDRVDANLDVAEQLLEIGIRVHLDGHRPPRRHCRESS